MYIYIPLAGHVGPPFVCNYIKLVDVPDMEYYTSNDQGEVSAQWIWLTIEIKRTQRLANLHEYAFQYSLSNKNGNVFVCISIRH